MVRDLLVEYLLKHNIIVFVLASWSGHDNCVWRTAGIFPKVYYSNIILHYSLLCVCVIKDGDGCWSLMGNKTYPTPKHTQHEVL